MKYIEKNFPIQYLNPVAMAEGNSKKPVYQMHKWWARRLGSVFRMINLGVFSSIDDSDEDIWNKFCSGTNLDGLIVLDPFMGGGTTIIESLRLGCKVIGIDINPVAWFITKKGIEAVDLGKLDDAFYKLEKTAGRFIRQYYCTKCPQGHHAEVMYYFWVKIANCVSCGSTVRLFTNYELSRQNHFNIVLCPNCLQIFQTPRNLEETKCPECDTIFKPHIGVSAKGKFTCPNCNAEQKILEAIKNNGGRLNHELYALEGYCTFCGRFFKRIDSHDIALWEKARNEFEKHKNKFFIPTQKIPVEGRSDPRPVNHGFSHYWHMFNERQLLCLSYLLSEIIKIPDLNIMEYMLVAFSDCLDANNMFCKYETQWHKISLFFGLHAYHPIERPTENNVWGTKFGRCTFVKCFEKVRRAKLYCQKPYERLVFGNKRLKQYTINECIQGTLVQSYEELCQVDRAALLRCDNAENMAFISSKAIDAVITDPPYFDNIQYSELADFFYVWLRLGLKNLYPCFEFEFSGHQHEIVQNNKVGKSLEFFSKGLKKVFTECNRVLKDEGLLVFTFHHNKLWAWENVGKILLDAGFYISACPIVRSEGKSGFHSSKGNIRYDCILVCRKRPSQWEVCNWSLIREHILKDAILWTKKTLQSGMLVNDADLFTIIMGKTIEYYTKAFPNIKYRNVPFTLGEALFEMKTFVTYITERTQTEQEYLGKLYSKKAEQLMLFMREARQKYDIKDQKK